MIAKILALHTYEENCRITAYQKTTEIAKDLALYFKDINKNFDRDKFLIDCGIVEKTDYHDCWCDKENLVMPHDKNAHYEGNYLFESVDKTIKRIKNDNDNRYNDI